MCHHRGYPIEETDWERELADLREEDPEADEPEPEPALEPEPEPEPELEEPPATGADD